MYTHILNEDGVYIEPPTGGSRDATGDHVDYSRVIRLDRYPDLLDDVGKYLEDDLEAILAKYVDGAARRIDVGSKFGAQSHGFYDYIKVLEDDGDMTQAIAELLSTKRSRSVACPRMSRARA